MVNPKKRANISQIKDHPWLNNGVTFLNNLEEEEIRNKPKDESEMDLDVLDQIEQIGFEKEAVKVSLFENKFDPAAGAYYIFSYQKRKDADAFDRTVKEITSESFKKSLMDENEEISMRGEDETSSALAQLLLQAQRDEDPGPVKTPVRNHKPLAPLAQKQIKKGLSGNAPVKKPGIISISLDSPALPSRKSNEESQSRAAQINKKDPQKHPKHPNLPPIHKPKIDSLGTEEGLQTKIKSKERKLTIDETLYTNESSKTHGAHGIPRTIKHAFNCTAASTKSPDELFDKLRFTLDSNDAEWTHDKYLFDVACKSVQMEIEICKIPHMALHGLRFKKISGDIWQFKNQTSEICSSMGIGV